MTDSGDFNLRVPRRFRDLNRTEAFVGGVLRCIMCLSVGTEESKGDAKKTNQ